MIVSQNSAAKMNGASDNKYVKYNPNDKSTDGLISDKENLHSNLIAGFGNKPPYERDDSCSDLDNSNFDELTQDNFNIPYYKVADKHP